MEKEVIKKILVKILITMLIITAFLCIFSRNSFADKVIDPDEYKPSYSDTTTGAYKIKTMANRVIGTIQIIGSILSVAVLGILGIKYMMGSIEDKAEYKKTFKFYVIGAVMIFGIVNILAVIIKLSTQVFPVT